jgi:ornithine--oxo-acid transaminase
MAPNLVDSEIELDVSKSRVAELYAQHVNPAWVKLLDVLGLHVRYKRAIGAELHTYDGRVVLDCLSGYCVHNAGHKHPHIVAELVC